MNPPFRVDGDGNITDSQCYTVGCIRATDPAVKATMVFRLNLFDDMLRAIELLRLYPDGLPPMAKADVDMTYAAAKTAQ